MSVRVYGKERVVSATVTRPGGTTQYTAGDAVTDSTSAPTVITFSGAALALGGSGVIVGGVCIDSANQTVKPNLELYLFDSSVTPNNENEAWAPSDADLNKAIGVLEFSSWKIGNAGAGANGNILSIDKDKVIPFKCGATSADLYGLLVERGSYTPVASESWKIRLRII